MGAGFLKAIIGGIFSGLNEILGGWRRDRALKKEGAATVSLEGKEGTIDAMSETSALRRRIARDAEFRERMRGRFRDD